MFLYTMSLLFHVAIFFHLRLMFADGKRFVTSSDLKVNSALLHQPLAHTQSFCKRTTKIMVFFYGHQQRI